MDSLVMGVEDVAEEENSEDEQEVSVEKMGQFGTFIEDIKSELGTEIRTESIQAGTRRPKKLKSALAGLMGEANIKYASGNISEAISMSMEVIRNAPDSPDPFQLLAIIYEESGQMEKSLQYGLVAAFLTKNSVDEWMAVANKATTLKNFKLAHMCYEKICRLEPHNEKLWASKCEVMKQAGCDNKKILESYCHILDIVRQQGDADRYILMARSLFMEYVSLEEAGRAREVMTKALESHPNLVTKSDINLLIEVLFMQNDYKASLDVLSNHCGLKIFQESTTSPPQLISFEDDLPVDLLAKSLISLIHLEMHTLVDTVLERLLKEDCDVVGDLYMDVAEAFSKKLQHHRAEQIFKLLVVSSKYNLPAVWLKYGEAVKSQRKLTDAIEIFSHVVEMVPDHVEARITLSGLYQTLGCNDQALVILNSSVNLDNITETDLKTLIGYCGFLLTQDKMKEYVKLSMKVLRMCCNQVLVEKNKVEAASNRVLRLRNFVYHHAINHIFTKTDIPRKHINLLPLSNDIWHLYYSLKDVLHHLRRYEHLDHLTLLMLLCPAFFNDQARSNSLEFLCMIAGILNKQGTFAYYIARSHIVKGLDNSRIWNLMEKIIALSYDVKHSRFCIRLAMKQPNNLALCQLNGHNALMAGSYKHALGEYFMCVKADTSNPLHYFLIAVCYTHFVTQKFSSHRHALTNQAVSFFNHYRLLRGPHHETLYNIGRAMHQLGLLSLAVSFYEQVLHSLPPHQPHQQHLHQQQLPPHQQPQHPHQQPQHPQHQQPHHQQHQQQYDAIFDLRREAAYNLHLIYAKTSPQLARSVMHRYLVV